MPRAEHITLPRSTVKLFREARQRQQHPGLLLDKFAPPGTQEEQRNTIKEICEAKGDSDLLKSLRRRRTHMLETVRAKCFEATTAGPLTLHLARASALENAGIHMHPVYGFVCLPGSGIKGMARAYAETIWLTAQLDQKHAWKQILNVFGWSPGTDARKKWKPENAEIPPDSQTGAVIFHEAWPTKWPQLELDIANVHHKEYYGGDGEPGDWDSPNPIFFLAVSTGATFDFAVSLRGAGEENLLDLACEWLQGALVHEGAGAKTHAGYGRFRIDDPVTDAAPPEQARRTSQHRLELVTPAFLAGAEKEAHDCDLRPATLRGLLRWWWRTMYVAHLKTDDLRRLETAIWGSAEQGAALALEVQWDKGKNELAIRPAPQAYNKREIEQNHKLARPESRRTTQGLFYASYGMDEGPKKRYYVAPGFAWNVVLNARKSTLESKAVDSSEILRQGEAALWLLCRYGGVGSKARKGFGSFADISIDGIGSLDDCKRIGKEFRQKLGLSSDDGSEACSSLDHMLDELEIPTPWTNHWFVLDQLGAAAQGFAQSYKPKRDKAALGLPRKNLRNAHGKDRHASPVYYHMARAEDRTLTIRMVAFPSSDLPDLKTSKEVLRKLREHICNEIAQQTKTHADKGKAPVEPVQSTDTPAGTHFPKPNDRVRATLLEEKTKKGGWKARHDESGLEGVIQNHNQVPADHTAGQQVELIVAFCNPNEANKANRIAFRWPRLNENKPNQQRTRNQNQRGGKPRRRR